jgi:nitrate/nitrite-specific signal transduction histidine kinase
MEQSASADSGGPVDPHRPLTITLKDNGCGFDPQTLEQSRGHFGHKIMQERVDSLGGAIELRSFPNHGTTLQIFLPLSEGEVKATTELTSGV